MVLRPPHSLYPLDHRPLLFSSHSNSCCLLYVALNQLQSTYEAAQAVSVGCQALSRMSPVLQPCIASYGKSALATLLATAHVPPRAVTADDVQAPSSPKYMDQE